MILTVESDYRDVYESSTQEFRDAIDEAYGAAVEVLKDCGLAVNSKNAAEELIAALTKYVVQSEKENSEWSNEAQLS